MRLVLTTRSARYTGEMRFDAPFELIELALLNQKQIQQLCEHFRQVRKEEAHLTQALMSAIKGLEERYQGTDENDLVSNPLLLTAVCSLYYRFQRLPNDRAELCDKLISHLCEKRVSKDKNKNWFLKPQQKLEMLQHSAYAMQVKGW